MVLGVAPLTVDAQLESKSKRSGDVLSFNKEIQSLNIQSDGDLIAPSQHGHPSLYSLEALTLDLTLPTNYRGQTAI